MAFAGSAFAAEDLRGEADALYPPTLTLYGFAHDVANPGNNTFQVRVCWDSPGANCDTPVRANVSGVPTTTCAANCIGFQYPVPAGPVGSVNPRDGRPHMMYASIVSQSNPGAGDKPVDGTPFPFTYRNGAVAPMWAPNLGAPGRLNASQLAVFANSRDVYSIGSAGQTVCTVNGTAIKDDGVVGYYVQRHGVPCANVRVVSVVVTQSVPLASFNSGILPALQSLPGSIQGIAIGWVQPSFITGPVTDQSISSLMAMQGMVSGTGCVGGARGLGQGPINPYFNSGTNTPYTTHGLRPAMMLAGEACPTCTATDNVSHAWAADVPTMKRTIDAAIAGVDTNPAGGHVDLAWTPDPGRSVEAINASPLMLGNALSPLVYTQVIGSQKSPTPKVVTDQNILLYAEGSAGWNYAGETFVPGAGIGYGLTSTSGYLPYDHQQTNAASWLSEGAVASNGNAVEPCELLAYKSPDAGLVIPFYTQGETVVEALWKSVRLPWGANFVGDPLASPFALAGTSAPSLSGIAPGSGTQGAPVNVTLTGANFVAGSSVAVSGSGVSVSNTAVVSATQITATLTIAASAAAGGRGVTVTGSNGTTGAVTFTVNSAAAAPVVSSITPSTGTAGTSVNVTLTGSGFLAGAVVNVSGTGVTASNVAVVSATQMTATLTIAGSAAAGGYSVSVRTSAGTSGNVAFTVTKAGLPVLSATTPSSASPGATVNVALTGQNFVAPVTVRVDAGVVAVTNVVLVDSGTITAVFQVPANAPVRAYGTSVTTPAGRSNGVAFTVR